MGLIKTLNCMFENCLALFLDLKEVASSTTPKPAVHVISQCGVVTGASSAGSLLRSEWQVKNMRKRAQSVLKIIYIL